MEKVNLRKKDLENVVESITEIVGLPLSECFKGYSPEPRVHYLNRFDYEVMNRDFSQEQKLKLLELVFQGFSLLGENYENYIGPQDGYSLTADYRYSSKAKSGSVENL